MPHRRALGAVILLLATSTGLHAAAVTSVFSGRIPCAPQEGVQFCGGTIATRVESFDGVPLDLNLTLPPAAMDGPFPLIVDMHGWSLGKTGGPYVAWAQAGYAVLSYTARGFHGSCGSDAARAPDPTLTDPTVCATRGWIHLADARYEGHDTQHLAGLLADEGLVIPTKIGVTGASYGGGQTMILAALKDRTMQVDGTLVPWKSPGGLDMTIAAGAALIPWSDLAYSLTPNGRTLDYRAENPYGTRGGVQKQSWNAALYAVGDSSGYYAPPGVDFGADIRSWTVRIGQGEPYDGDSAASAILDEIATHHSAYYIDDSVAPAPLFIYSAWTDDLFPADEAIRFWRKTVAKHPGAELALHFADDFGHSRADLGFGGATAFQRATAFFGRHLKGSGDPLPVVETYTQACNGAAIEGPFIAGDWDAIHPGEVRYESRRTQRFTSAPGNEDTRRVTDPLNITGPCRSAPATDDPTAATYRLPAATGEGYTLLGSPTIVADVTVTGAHAQVVGRLWDVAPDGMQTLVAQAVYRPRTDNRGPQVFQLHPNAWRFAGGHVPKLELVGQSAGFMRPSNGTFAVTVRELELRLPVREAPSGEVILAPAAPVLPPADPEPIGCALAARTDCRPPLDRSSVSLAVGASKDGSAKTLAWRLRSEDSYDLANVGNPLQGESYLLCLYDDQTLIGSVAAPGGGTCGKRPCWKSTSTGYRYADKRAATGVQQVNLALPRGLFIIASVTGRGSGLGTPSLPVAGKSVTTQLVAGDYCWSATLTRLGRNTSRVLKARFKN